MKPRTTTICISILFWVCVSSLPGTAQDTLKIQYLEDIVIDGQNVEWGEIDSFYFKSPAQTNMNYEGEFSESDLDAKVKIAWNEESLIYFIEWEDNIIDQKYISIDSAMISLPNGQRMDKMYAYDNLKLQVWVNDFNYSIWFAPCDEAIQWHSMWQGKGPGSTKLKVDLPEYVRLLILISDSDAPDLDPVQKIESGTKYISIYHPAKLYR